ncbi:4-demethylwyosine synthase TYW1 [Candidatus Micrarchaeota archaeon CG08_land_8_20_14_0_20_59_11]|nr:MAG: 4-demethylwyosine synthase TYW1 [Candidatus Micrarchaeota archaeon CG08_land_8_20_14_0_20_59_11]PIT85246.1 MAG: 4-demethylwyosine synthase TYW1 [Candidatus Micrarchaeota archaeon CG10_big_fil_rev_8_21_14_0_10_59_7]
MATCAIPQNFIDKYERQQYSLVGEHKHSAVKICSWTKRALLGSGSCYKQKFYGIQSHRCLQMTPSLFWCTFRCLHCWRSIEANLGFDMSSAVLDDPEKILDGAVAAQRKLLIGFKGNEKANAEKWREAQNPNQVAISLAGEPTLYPKLSGLIRCARRRGMTTFLVTNGTQPGALLTLKEQDALPTQLYVSLCAFDKESYARVHQPVIDDGLERLLETLRIYPALPTRRVIRLTLSKGLNFSNPKKYAALIKQADPDWVEAKSYMAVGYSRNRLGPKYMIPHEEIREFSEELARHSGYEITDEQKESRVVLLSRDAQAAANRFITQND